MVSPAPFPVPASTGSDRWVRVYEPLTPGETLEVDAALAGTDIPHEVRASRRLLPGDRFGWMYVYVPASRAREATACLVAWFGRRGETPEWS